MDMNDTFIHLHFSSSVPIPMVQLDEHFQLIQRRQQQHTSANQQRSSSGSHPPFRFIILRNPISATSFTILLCQVMITNTFTVSTNVFLEASNIFLIKIGFINRTQSLFDVILFDTRYLPRRNHQSFYLVQLLLKMIFHRSNTLHGWNLNKHHFDGLVRAEYFSQIEIDQITITDLQDRFKQWYNRIYKHKEDCPVQSDEIHNDDPSCICSYRPYKNRTDKWHLMSAYKSVFRLKISIPREKYDNPRWMAYYYLCLHHFSFIMFLKMVEFDWNLAKINQYRQSFRH